MNPRPKARLDSDGTGARVEAEQTRSAHVLVIDDDPSLCQLTELTLTRAGYRVSTCSDSSQVLGLLKDSSYDCVLLDIRMQGLEGTDLLPIIKRHQSALPVVIVSAYCDRSDAGYYSSLGAFELVTKPFTSERLLDVVSRAVGTTEMIPLVLTSLSLAQAREQAARKVIITALKRANWNQVKAARLLGISRYSLIRALRKLQITY